MESKEKTANKGTATRRRDDKARLRTFITLYPQEVLYEVQLITKFLAFPRQGVEQQRHGGDGRLSPLLLCLFSYLLAGFWFYDIERPGTLSYRKAFVICYLYNSHVISAC